MLSTLIRSRTARSLGALLGALALTAALPATASADRDGRLWRSERDGDHGRRGHDWRGRDHGRERHHGHFRRGFRPAYVQRHGASCSPRAAYRYGHRPYAPYAAFYRHGVSFGR